MYAFISSALDRTHEMRDRTSIEGLMHMFEPHVIDRSCRCASIDGAARRRAIDAAPAPSVFTPRARSTDDARSTDAMAVGKNKRMSKGKKGGKKKAYVLDATRTATPRSRRGPRGGVDRGFRDAVRRRCACGRAARVTDDGVGICTVDRRAREARARGARGVGRRRLCAIDALLGLARER